ncbi:Gfo/Idh/MocA family protein [Aurantiacibacter luteus]|uniref:Galactose 1-dehydrogenase n=1 Tax=Aurantiacibacter luteus TaxID=1581420 RepID=A0A0G9MYW7_9SPHN|nr:Gfo/Idh/MocA family oxidoreductase [Aurantiacibacter luteus]KLE35941.1 galactose 1-dehydrogenase [Aurantiacibacter luteus]
MTKPIRLAVIGMGKIACDQHLPSIAGTQKFELVATVSRDGKPSVDGVQCVRSIEELADSGIGIDAVSICTPPQVRHDIAQFAIEQGWHTMLEKPPGATLAEVIALRDAAKAAGVTLFATWHSRYAAMVEPARAWLRGREIRRAKITWREDVRVWHPGQEWIWQPGGFGVFDPGINALSIITRILPEPLFVTKSQLFFPGNQAAPIAAEVSMRDRKGVPVEMDLDFRQEGPQHWDIDVETDAGTLSLSHGGAKLSIAGVENRSEENAMEGEYPGLYKRFAALVWASVSDVDVSPLRLVADAFLCGRITMVEDFIE